MFVLQYSSVPYGTAANRRKVRLTMEQGDPAARKAMIGLKKTHRRCGEMRTDQNSIIADGKNKRGAVGPATNRSSPVHSASRPCGFRKPHEVFEFSAIAVKVIAASALRKSDLVVVSIAISQ